MRTRHAAGLVLALATAAATGAGSPGPASAAAADPRPLVRLADERIDSSSGLAVSPDNRLLYTVEDAGKETAVYAVDLSGHTRAVLQLPGVTNEDWEDLDRGTDERGRPALFVADLGDAYFLRRGTEAGERTRYALLRFTEPQVDLSAPPAEIRVDDLVRFPVAYADGEGRNSEALAVQPGTGRVFVVDKTEDETTTAHVWVAPARLSTQNSNTLQIFAQVPVTQATAAAFSPDGGIFALRNYSSAYMWRVRDGDLGRALRERPAVLDLPPQRQGEGLAFTPDGAALLLSSEGPNSLVWEVPVPPLPELAAEAAPASAAEPDRPDLVALGVLAAALLGVVGIVLEARVLARRRRARADAAAHGVPGATDGTATGET